MGKNWNDIARKNVYKKDHQIYGRVQKFINLKLSEEDNTIYDCRNGVEYTLVQAKELIKGGWAETKDPKLLSVLEKEES